jgi:transposase
MRGRYPAEFVVKIEHLEILQAIVRDGHTEQRIARRARILLMRAGGERVETVAEQVGQDTATVFRVCQRYHDRGVEAIYDAVRSGRPRVFSPSGTRPHRKSGL